MFLGQLINLQKRKCPLEKKIKLHAAKFVTSPNKRFHQADKLKKRRV